MTKNFKVLMLGWELPPFNSGGLGEACLGLTAALSVKGIQTTFVLPYRVDLTLSHMRVVFANDRDDWAFAPHAYAGSELVRRFSVGEALPPDFVVASIKYAKNMRAIIKKYGPFDIVHMHDWMTFPAGIVAKNTLGVPLIAHVHSTEIDRTGGIYPNKFVFDIEKQGFAAADSIIVVGGFMKHLLTDNYQVDSDKIHVVYNAVDNVKRNVAPSLEKLRSRGFKVVLFLGRITLQKGPEYFVRAAARTLEFYPNTVFVVTGSGDMQESMVGEASALKILDKFIFTGFLRGEERDRIFQAADVYVMPSVSEPFGITALESIVNETPIIISKTSGAAEILKNALKVDFWDIDEITNKIIAVLKYQALKEELISGGKAEIEAFTWDKSADQVLSIYNTMTSN